MGGHYLIGLKKIFKKCLVRAWVKPHGLGTMLTIFLPTILMDVIAQCTNYFKPFFFEVWYFYNYSITITGVH